MKKFVVMLALYLICSHIVYSQENDQRNSNLLINEAVDVVIPAHEKDIRTLDMAIDGIKTNGKNIRRVIVVSAKQFTQNAEWFDEALYPFSKKDVLNFIKIEVLKDESKDVPRLGWIYQQLLKLYAPITIPDISHNVLILDADTIFLRPIEFIDTQGSALYDVETQYQKSYFEHAIKLIRDNPIAIVFPYYSGITNHMLMRREVIDELFECIFKTHNIEPWKAILHCIDPSQLRLSCLSEYEIYFNFIFARKNDVKIRRLKSASFKFDVGIIKQHQGWGYDYVSCHAWM